MSITCDVEMKSQQLGCGTLRHSLFICVWFDFFVALKSLPCNLGTPATFSLTLAGFQFSIVRDPGWLLFVPVLV